MPIVMLLQEQQLQLSTQQLQQGKTSQRSPVPRLLLCWPADQKLQIPNLRMLHKAQHLRSQPACHWQKLHRQQPQRGCPSHQPLVLPRLMMVWLLLLLLMLLQERLQRQVQLARLQPCRHRHLQGHGRPAHQRMQLQLLVQQHLQGQPTPSLNVIEWIISLSPRSWVGAITKGVTSADILLHSNVTRASSAKVFIAGNARSTPGGPATQLLSASQQAAVQDPA